jgi:GWxTD domain-containing protein
MISFYLLFVGINVDFQIDRDTSSIPYVVVNYGLPYSDLIFQKKDTVYYGEFLTSLVLKKDNYQLGGESKRNEFSVYKYKETTSDDIYYRDLMKMKIPEGKIEVVLRVSDRNSNRVWSRSAKLEVSRLKPTDIGSIRWFSNPSREVITDKDTVRIGLNIFSFEKGKTHLNFYFTDEDKETYFKRDTVLPDKKNQNVEVTIPADRFEEGFYNFIAEVKNVNKEEVVKKSISFMVWRPFFKSKRYFERIKQIAYISSIEEEKKLLNAKVEEREKVWNEFWESKDPTPEDGVNEFLVEYFQRVDYANKNFGRGSLFEGWRTDRGKVYIVLGPPDYVVDEPFNPSGDAYQIWYYYDKGYDLIFVQRYMTGDYELQNPPPEVW